MYNVIFRTRYEVLV